MALALKIVMKQLIKVGNKIFKYKKDALSHFKNILNSYDFGESLISEDFNDVYELLKKHPRAEGKIGVGIKDLKIGKVQHNTKCFEFVRTDFTTGFFGYNKCINGARKAITDFSRACRRAIQEDLRNVKTEYFKKYSKKGRVKCQETGELLLYEDLNVDHRQPNTFSIIVDRFIEVNKCDLNSIEYVATDDYAQELADIQLIKKFREYHKEKANLRLVKKELNLGRSHQAKITTQKKDLKIE